jgi:dienelactone hydrolase
MPSTTLEYRDGDVRLKGVLVQPEKRSAGSAIVLFPDARGVGAHAIECAGRLAALGYLTLVADLYGEGILARDMTHAGELMAACAPTSIAGGRGRAPRWKRSHGGKASIAPGWRRSAIVSVAARRSSWHAAARRSLPS